MRRLSIAAFGVIALALSAAGLAWACTAEAYLGITGSSSGDPRSGPPGTEIQLVGHQWHQGAVEIYWNGVSGALLGTVTGPSFETTVIVPEGASEDVGYIYAQASDPNGAYVFSSRTSFVVTGPEAETAETGGGEAPGTGETDATASGEDGRNPAKSPAPRQNTSGGPASNNPRTVTTAAGRQVFGPSVASATAPADSAKPSRELLKFGSEASTPSERIASSERLFSGLESPAVLPSPFDSAVGSESTNLLIAGVGLLGAGLVAMFGGVLIAELRRRRMAEAGRRSR